MAKLTPITDDHFAALLESIQPPQAPQVSPQRTRLREYVAILTAFDAASLAPLTPGLPLATGVARDPEADSFLAEDCEHVVTPGGHRWSLREDVRQDTLAALDRQGRLSQFPGATDEDDAACRMALRYIHGNAPPLGQQTLEELQGSVEVSGWLSETTVAVPGAAQVRAQIAIEGMLQPLRTLVADGFFGRVSELNRLSDYAEVLPPSRWLSGVARRVRRITNLYDKPPLLIYGPGGAGKSTLVATFVLDHIDAEDIHRFPFAYLSFDRSELRPEQPLSLLAEAASQLGALFPGVTGGASVLAASARSVVASTAVLALDRRSTKGSSSSTLEREGTDEQILISRFAALIEQAVGTRDVPHVWVLDTFEVAQRQAPTAVDRLWRFLGRLQQACPRLRVVLCGRAPISDHKTSTMHLGGLDRESALQMLRTQLADLDLPDAFLRKIIEAVSTQPLSLRLAALLVRAEAAKAIGTKDWRRDLLLRLPSNEVQGVLYRRILDHIADPDVRRIAHPGFALRRLTPGVIEAVLAPRCGLGDVDGQRAQELFDSLLREISLVEPDGSDGLRLRPDIRRVILPMIERDDPELLASLRGAALRYFSKQDSFQAKIEELYYRLALGQSTTTLDRAYDTDAAAALDYALEEFPASSQVYLANRLGVTVSPDVRRRADDLSWARQTTLAARRLLDAGRPAEALELVRVRRSGTVRPFTAALEIEALAALGRHDEALASAATAAQWCTDHQEIAVFVEVALLAARVEEDIGDFGQALRWLREVDRVAESAHDRISRLTARVAMLRIHRREGTLDSDDVRLLRADVIEEAGSPPRTGRTTRAWCASWRQRWVISFPPSRGTRCGSVA